MERIKPIETEGQKFHFEKIAEIEPEMTVLVEKLKEEIDSGEYDCLISDDVGGRIPTLVFREIIKNLYPERNLGTYFIAAGHYLPKPGDPDYEVLLDHLKKIAEKDNKKALVVTQFIFGGGTVVGLSEALNAVGIESDIAATHSYENHLSIRGKLFTGPLLEGIRLHEEHEELSGVRKKRKEYQPFPRRDVDVINAEGRERELSLEEWREVFGIKPEESIEKVRRKNEDPEKVAEWERRVREKLSPEEIDEMREKVLLAREDVKLLAQRIVSKVWGEKKN